MARYTSPSQITVGVVGYGGAFNMGKYHLDQMKQAGMTPLAVVELDAARLEVAKKDFPGIETYPSVDAMLAQSKVQLVVIITPHNTHAEIALKCLKAGKHVVCEKPLAITTAECDAMIAAAKAAGTCLSTYHNRHWDGHILKAVELIRGQKAIGEVTRIECHMGGYAKPGDWWRTSKTISGGILYDWGVHLLEYSLQLIDGEISEVSGYAKQGFWAPQTAWKNDCNEDEGLAIVRFKGGQWLSLCITNLDANPKRGILEITGTKGTYVMDFPHYELITPDGADTRIVRGKNPDGQQHLYYQNVADHLVKDAKLVITPEWSRRPIHILDLADRSIKQGCAQRAQYG
jgi:predicted dehydrogenase